MKRTGLCLGFTLLLMSNNLKAQDGFFSDAQTLRSQQLALGVQPVIYTQSEDVMLNLRAGYGLQPGLTLHGKLGVFRDETYVGGHLEYRLAAEPQSDISFAILAGVYGFGEVGLKLSGVVSKRFDPFSIYTGLSYEPLFTDETLNPLMLPVGVDIPLVNEQANFILEADIAVSEDGETYQAVNFGINFYL